MTHLLHVVPSLPPVVSGVGDFARLLGDAVERITDGALRSQYVAAGWDVGGASAPAIDLTGQRSPSALCDAVVAGSPAAVLVHVVGYGYERRGCPVWLVEAVRAVRRARPGLRVLTWFHEVYAFGPPWRSSFWLSPVQRRIAADLAGLSDAALTNRHASADWLRRHAPGTPVEVCPTPSNVGEPETARPWKERAPVAVVFGGAGQREAVYATANGAARQMLSRSGVERIWDVGPPAEVPGTYADWPVEPLGPLDAGVVSERLQAARVGLVHYPPSFVTKSGIVAAYLAHGVPVCTVSADHRPSGAQPPPMADLASADRSDLARLSAQGHRWYTDHAHSARAAYAVVGLITGAVPTASTHR